jgi:hypothetical protein
MVVLRFGREPDVPGGCGLRRCGCVHLRTNQGGVDSNVVTITIAVTKPRLRTTSWSATMPLAE